MATLKISRGYETLVDDADLELLSAYNWYALPDKKNPDRIYVRGEKRRNKKGFDAKGNRLSLIERTTQVALARLLTACPDDMEVDHINGNTLDNRRANLRIVTRSQNLQNRGKFSNNTTGFKGVRKIKNGYRAVIHVLCDSAEEAARMYDRLASIAYGAHARLNFPKDEAELSAEEQDAVLNAIKDIPSIGITPP